MYIHIHIHMYIRIYIILLYIIIQYLSIVTLYVQPSDSRVVPLHNFHAWHEARDADVVGHGLRKQVLPRNVHISSGQGEITEKPTAILEKK